MAKSASPVDTSPAAAREKVEEYLEVISNARTIPDRLAVMEQLEEYWVGLVLVSSSFL